MMQQPGFYISHGARRGAGESTQSRSGNDTMTGNNDGRGIAAASLANGTRGTLQPPSQFTVGHNISNRDGQQAAPDTLLEWRA